MKKIKTKEIIFGCTGTIGETFPTEKIKKNISDIVEKIKYTQNKYVWTKAALGIMTTDQVPKLAMEECKIGNTLVKIYGVAKGSGMIYPNMATTLGYIFTDAKISPNVLKKLLSKNIETTFIVSLCCNLAMYLLSRIDTGTTIHSMLQFYAKNNGSPVFI